MNTNDKPRWFPELADTAMKKYRTTSTCRGHSIETGESQQQIEYRLRRERDEARAELERERALADRLAEVLCRNMYQWGDTSLACVECGFKPDGHAATCEIVILLAEHLERRKG